MKKSVFFVIALIVSISMLAACAPVSTPATAVPNVVSTVKPLKVVIIGNQRFGDLGPMDQMATGLDKCATDFGIEIKKLESTDAGRFEEDIRGMASAGYDMIMTTFPPMTDATVTVAKEFPAVKFYAIYQFANAGDDKTANVWSVEFRGYQANYAMGAFAGKLSTSKKLGYVYGAEDPSINSDVNGFVQGVKDTCPECTLEVANANSWEDPALGKEIANAMISHGVDFIQTEAAKTQLGVIEAAKATNILFSGDNGDNYTLYPAGFVTYIDASFTNAVYNACKALSEGNAPMGQHTFLDITNQGVFAHWEFVDRFVTDNPTWATAVNAAETYAKDIQAQIISGAITVTYDEKTPAGIQ
jgi:basic membrane protein A